MYALNALAIFVMCYFHLDFNTANYFDITENKAESDTYVTYLTDLDR